MSYKIIYIHESINCTIDIIQEIKEKNANITQTYVQNKIKKITHTNR